MASVGSVVKHSSPGKSRLQSACTIKHQVYARSLPPPRSGGRPISAKGWKRCHALPPLGKKQRPRPMLQRTPNLCAERLWKRPSWPQPPDCEYQTLRHSQLIRHTCPLIWGLLGAGREETAASPSCTPTITMGESSSEHSHSRSLACSRPLRSMAHVSIRYV